MCKRMSVERFSSRALDPCWSRCERFAPSHEVQWTSWSFFVVSFLPPEMVSICVGFVVAVGLSVPLLTAFAPAANCNRKATLEKKKFDRAINLQVNCSIVSRTLIPI